MNRKCTFTIAEGSNHNTYLCGRTAKWKTPEDTLNKKQQFVCGIHKNSVDKMYKRINSKLRCKRVEL